MQRIARRLFATGSIVFVLIGALHTWVHLAEMRTPELKAQFDQIAPIDGTDVWHLWNGLSLLMGFGFIAIGLANIAGLRALPEDSYPVRGVALANAAMLASITTIGFLHLGPNQQFGGPVGVIMFGLPALWSTLDKRKKAATPGPADSLHTTLCAAG